MVEVVRRRDLRFTWTVTALVSATITGFYIDLWAHQHGRTDNTFFTPWHAMLYGAEGSLFAFLAVTAARNVRRGAAWRSSLPAGYGVSLIGAVLFAVGGVLDLLWHLAFGVEVSIDALFSPTHLILFTSGLLMFAGPLRAWWASHPRATDWRAWLPVVISVAAIMSILTAITSFADPLADAWSERDTTPVTQRPYVDVYVMRADGSRQTRVIVGPEGESAHAAVWSPDGRRITFAQGADGQVYTANADGSTPQRLGALTDAFPGGWSADGTRLVYSAGRSGSFAVYTVAADGSGPKRLASGARAVWSPDGKRIAFNGLGDGAQADVFVIDADGTNQRRLTDSPAHDYWPAWSPDGRRIAFVSHRDGGPDIYVMNADGSEVRRLTSAHGGSWGPSWSPDSTRIVFLSGRDENTEIYVMNADGADQRNLSRSPGLSEDDPVFSPDGSQVLYDAIAHPAVDSVPRFRETVGMAGILLYAAIVGLLLALLLRSGPTPFGTMTLLLGVNAILMTFVSDQERFVPAALAAGLIGDLLIRWLRPSPERRVPLRVVAFAVPAIFFAGYFLTLLVAGNGIGWSFTLWTGAIILAGGVGVLASYVLESAALSAPRVAP